MRIVRKIGVKKKDKVVDLFNPSPEDLASEMDRCREWRRFGYSFAASRRLRERCVGLLAL